MLGDMKEMCAHVLKMETINIINGRPLQYSRLENPHRQRSQVGYSPWGCKESDITEQLNNNMFEKSEPHIPRGVENLHRKLLLGR